MKLNKEQDLMVGKAFMTAMAKKMYRDGNIDVSTLNRLMIKIDKVKEFKDRKTERT